MAGGYSVTFSVVDNATRQIDAITKRIQQMRAPMERQARSMQKFIDVSGLRKIGDGFNWIARTAGTALRVLTSVVPALGAITSAATIAGMTRLVAEFAKWGNQLKTNADQIGISAEELQKFQDATTRAGGSAEDMTTTLQNLHRISADAFTGMNNEAKAMFARFNISLTDANGHLKTATELLPEVFHALDSLKDPADRARVASVLLSDAQNKLYEEYKQSGKPLEDWLKIEDKHLHATDAQLESLNKYRLAVSGLETDFNQLGRQVAATLADDFTPLITALDQWVQQNQPQILAAVNAVSDAFKDLVSNIDWDSVKHNIDESIKALRIMKDVLDSIVKAVQLTSDTLQRKNFAITKEDVFKNSPFYSNLTDAQKAQVRQQLGITDEDVQKAQQEQQQQEQSRPFSIWHPNTWLRHGANEPAPGRMNLPQSNLQRGAAIRDRLAHDLKLSNDQAAGIVGNLQGESGLQAVNEKNPLVPGSRGGFGWAQWTGPRRVAMEQWSKEHNLDPKSDEANYGYLLHELRSPEYAPMLAQLRASNGYRESTGIVESQFERPAVSNVGVRTEYTEQFATAQAPQAPAPVAQVTAPPTPAAPPPVAALPTPANDLGAGQFLAQRAAAQAPPAAPPPPAAPLEGNVDVNITHRNAPPDATVTAQGKGSVNVQPLRIEHPQVDFGQVA